MSVLSEPSIVKPSFVIDANSKYDFSYKESDVYMLTNVPEDVNYQTTATNSSGLRNLSFTIKNPAMFLDRGISLNIDEINLTMKRDTVPTEEPTMVNYIEKYFDNYNDLALRQFAFLNAIDNIKINLDGTVFTVNNIADMLKICSKYYDESVVNDKIDASLPDLMDYKNYKSTATAIETLSENGNVFKCKPSISNTFSPFANMGTADYNTRQPSLIFHSSAGGVPWATATDDQKKTISVKTTGFQCFLPFSIFSIPGDNVPLAGVKSIELTINLKTNWWNYLFSSSGFITNIDITSGFTKLASSLNWRSYTPPEYVGRELNKVPEYSVAFPTVEMSNNVKEVVVTTSATLPSLEYDLRAIPKAVYIAAKLKQSGDSDTMKSADVYARIDNINIEMCGKKTQTYSNSSGIYTLAKNNGLNLSKESMYISGFPLKIVTSDDLGCKTNSLVGSVNNISNRLLLTNIKLSNVARYGVDSTFEVVVIIVYDGLLNYREGKFTHYESLISMAHELSVDVHASELYNGQIQAMNNVVGGSIGTIFGSMVPYLKKAAKGAFNIGKQAVMNKNFRNAMLDVANGKQVNWNTVEKDVKAEGYATTGGAFSSHSPIFGGSRGYSAY